MTNKFFEAVLLDENSKEELCRQLLAEFGVTNINKTHKGELIHSCCLPFGLHKNGDRNPSASLNFKKLTYRCLGCGSKGGLLWFIASCRGEDSQQARDWLNQETGLGKTLMELPTLLRMIDEMYRPQVDSLPPIPAYDDRILEPWTWDTFHPYLTDGAPEFGFEGRHIPESTLKQFRIGYAENYFDSGVERIIIPLWWNDTLVGWQARCVDATGHSDKYRNSPDFPKEQTIYNYHGYPTAISVESPMSVLRHYHHESALQSTFGAGITEEQIRLMQRYDNLVVWYDNDEAGWAATRAVGSALERSVQVWVPQCPYAADPADLPDDLVDELIATAVPYSIWSPPTELKPWSD